MKENKNEESQIVIGEPVPEGYIDELKELKSVVSYEKGIAKTEDFAKWVFTSSSIIGVLGAGGRRFKSSHPDIQILLGSERLSRGILYFNCSIIYNQLSQIVSNKVKYKHIMDIVCLDIQAERHYYCNLLN